MSSCKGTYNVVGNFAHLGGQGGCGCGSCHNDPTQSDAVIYSGPNLPCTGITTCTTLTDALMNIDAQICELIQEIFHLTSSTTTTLAPCALIGDIICPECIMVLEITC